MNEQKTIAAEIGEELLRRGQTMATAESCTGGNIAHQVTLVPGSSAWFRGGVVSYTNDVKMNVLQVPRDLIDRYTEVSTQVAEAMAKGVCLITDADFAVSTTGIAGPTGATDNNPVGTVCIGVATPHKVVSARLVFGSDRQSNIDSFTDAALRMLLDSIRS